MNHFLLFDSGCSLCTGLAQAVERESDGLVTAKSLRDQEMQNLLAQARPDWKHEPTLLEMQDDHASAFTGIAMRVRLLAILGPQRAYRVANVVRGFGVSITGLELSRRSFFSYSAKALAGFALLGMPGLRNPAPAALPPQTIPPTDDLQPGVREFIAGNYLGHAAGYPDPNETVNALRAFLDGDTFLRAGQVDEAVALLTAAVANNPESRHTHAGLGAALWQRHVRDQSPEDLRAAAQEFLTADEIGIQFGRVHYTYEIAMTLGALQDAAALDRYFEVALAKGNREYLASLHYARGLQLLDDPRAEKWFRKAMAVEPQGISDALAYYAEWLLDRGQNDAVVKLVDDKVDLLYAHFLKGVALERLGRIRKAQGEYNRYRPLNRHFPAPTRFKIRGSSIQQSLTFDGDPMPEASVSDALAKLSRVIAGEAGGEKVGGKRAVGWTVRTRVFKAYDVSSTCGGKAGGNGCWGAADSTASLPDRYIAICDSTFRPPECKLQFVQVAQSPSSDQQAYNVYYGNVPDPVVVSCIAGYLYSGSWCAGACSGGTTNGAFLHGPAWFQKSSLACPGCHPSCTCATSAGKTCGNGGDDNCFYTIK